MKPRDLLAVLAWVMVSSLAAGADPGTSRTPATTATATAATAAKTFSDMAPVAVVTTTDGRTFKDVKVIGVHGDQVVLIHSEGVNKIKLAVLSDETRNSLGLRTRKEQAAYEAEQAALAAKNFAANAVEAPPALEVFPQPKFDDAQAADATPKEAAQSEQVPSGHTVDFITTADGRTFKDVTVRKVEGDTVLLFHSGGAARVPLSALSDETRIALGLRTRSEQAASEAEQAASKAKQAAFEAEQAKKGLVKSGADWVTPEEKKSRDADAKAQKAVDAQSEKGVTYRVSQVMEDGSVVCYKVPIVDGKPFLLYGSTTKTVVQNAVYTHDLYWFKTETDTSEEGVQFNLKIYALDRHFAIEVVKASFKVVPTDKAAMDNARAFGTGFAIAEDGYIITAYHVISDATSIRVETEKPTRATLGVSIGQLTRDLAKSHGADGTEGVLIGQVEADSTAGRADFRKGDIITKIAGRSVKSPWYFLDAFEPLSPGEKVAIEIVRDGKALTILVVLGGRRELLEAEVVAVDRGNDLALLKVNKKTDCVALSSASTGSLGQTVFTVGFPMPDLQGFSPKVTKGVISGLKGLHDDVTKYQIDASIQPGNSGGPVADERGNVVGVAVSSLNDTLVLREKGVVPQNVNYSLKLSYVLALLDANPEVAKKIHVAKDDAKVSFEEAVEKVRKATVIIVSY